MVNKDEYTTFGQRPSISSDAFFRSRIFSAPAPREPMASAPLWEGGDCRRRAAADDGASLTATVYVGLTSRASSAAISDAPSAASWTH